jgi:hypothetical protein
MIIRDSQFRLRARRQKSIFKKKTPGLQARERESLSMRNEEFGYNPSIAHLEELEAIKEILEKTQTIMVGIGFLNCLLLLIILFNM